MKKKLSVLLLLATVGFSNVTLAAEPSLHEVYQAANAGKLDDAQRMMREVLQAHPQSGKAHYVEAELLAKQGKQQQAAEELATAEKLAPGLPFASAQSVAGLRQAVGRHETTGARPASAVPALPTPASPVNSANSAAPAGMPWGMLLIVLAAVAAFIVWASRLMSRRNVEGAGAMTAASAYAQPGGYAQPYPPSPPAGTSPAPGWGAQGWGASAPGGMTPAAEPGLGSRMLGGLATGAAVGAGVVAGEALMHRFFDGHKDASGNAAAAGNGQNNGQSFGGFDDIPSLPSTPLDGLGGNDFGIADGGSWDDGGGGDDDWN